MKFYIFHRLPERTFKIGKWYFPVCSRCTGIYLGICLWYALLYFIPFQFSFNLIIISVLMTAPTFIDATYQLYSSYESNNTLRFTTGLIAGFGLLILAKSFNIILGFNNWII